MQINNAKFANLVAVSGGEYEHVSEGFAKHLPYQHAFSNKRHPVDQAAGMIPNGVVICSDAYFFAKERIAAYQAKNGGAADYPASGETIAMAEWPTSARIRGIRFLATTAASDPGEFNTAYFDADTAAAFPAFTLQANDPNDEDFTPIPLLEDVDYVDDTVTISVPAISLAALAYGVNKRKDPLIIECVLGGNVVANSGLAVFVDFVVPHT